MCIRTIAAPLPAVRVRISGSCRPAETSLMILAPHPRALSATAALVVSMLTMALSDAGSPRQLLKLLASSRLWRWMRSTPMSAMSSTAGAAATKSNHPGEALNLRASSASLKGGP